MSQVKLDLIWQHNRVLPYIFGSLQEKITGITPVHKIYLIGSRAYTPLAKWPVLDGKDWDIIVVCDFAIVNTDTWTTGAGYYIDLLVINPQRAARLLKNSPHAIELYPVNRLELEMP